MFVLVAVGETHRWYGNFSFVRMWQGKSIFLSVFMPLVYAYALRFAVRPNLRDWVDAGGGSDRRRGLQLVRVMGRRRPARSMALCSAVRPSLPRR